MKKKILMLAFAALLTVGTSGTAFAAEIIPTTETLPIVDQQTTSDGKARESWGQGILCATNPISGNPYAYAETKTYAGTAYKLTAQTVVIDANSLSYYTPVATAYNASSVKSDTIISRTKKTFFIGNHTIQSTSGSAVQSCTTSKDYKN